MNAFRHQSPLRYPGGKQRLAPFFEELLRANGLVGRSYAEPYAGGAGIAFELLLAGLVSEIHLNDASRPVVAFWESVFHRTNELVAAIESVPLTVAEWRRQRETLRRESEFDSFSAGFAFFFLNRCNRSGIPGGGVIGGLAQDGIWKIDARFNRIELVRRIQALSKFRNAVYLSQLDAEMFITRRLPALPRKTLVYLDPPYYGQGRRLYLNHYAHSDHARVATLITEKISQPWVVSYDAIAPILRLYAKEPKRITYSLLYSAARAYRGREVMVFSSDLAVPSASRVHTMNPSLAQLPRRIRERLSKRTAHRI